MDPTAGHAGTASVAILLLVTLLAGCTGAPTGGGPANASGGGDAGPAGPEGAQAGAGAGDAAATATYAFPGEPTAEVRWMNGSFAPHEACLPAGCVAGAVTGDPPNQHALDLSADAPAAVPTRIEADLTFERTATLALSFFLRTDDATEVLWSSTSVDFGERAGRIDALVVKAEGGSVEVVVDYQAPDADDAWTYEVRAAVAADPTVVPERAPVAFEHPGGGATVRFAPGGADGGGEAPGGGVQVMLWDPTDAFVGHLALDGSAGYALPLDGPAGAYVVYVVAVEEGRGVRVSAAPSDDQAPGGLRALTTEATLAEGRDAPPTGEVEWSFTLDRVPLGVGLWAGGSGGYQMAEPAGEVASPEGTVLSFESTSFSVSGGTGTSAWWSLGSSAMVAGEYQATFSTTASGGMQVGELVVDYVR